MLAYKRPTQPNGTGPMTSKFLAIVLAAAVLQACASPMSVESRVEDQGPEQSVQQKITLARQGERSRTNTP